jgi:hypothetical protein
MRTVKLDAMMFLIALFIPGFASAADNLPSVASVLAPREPEPSAQDTSHDFGAAMAVDQLDGYRGGNTEVNNTALSKGVVEDNTAINVSSGVNTITGGSFANASGLPMVIQNSGSNVLIQNSTIVNVQLQ